MANKKTYVFSSKTMLPTDIWSTYIQFKKRYVDLMIFDQMTQTGLSRFNKIFGQSNACWSNVCWSKSVSELSISQTSVDQMSVSQMSVSNYLLAKCLLAKCLLAKCLLAKHPLTKCLSTIIYWPDVC
jgi:hypothetical protein